MRRRGRRAVRSEAGVEGGRKRRVMNRRGKWCLSHQKTRESERRESSKKR